ncbi:MAG TPA: hypothetical protein VKQ32_23670 [Polyangia bacterium]|nr:hypothetical protein [Polyangia bacterium]
MSKRVLIALSVLALAQAAALIWLATRMGDTPVMQADPMYPISLWEARAAFGRGAGHLVGTLLIVPWLLALPSLAPLGKLPRLLFIAPAISAASWIAWVAQGLPAHDRSFAYRICGAVGLMAGTIIPLVAIVMFRIEAARSPEKRAAAPLGIGFAATVLLWAWAFAVVQAELVLGMVDTIRSLKQ